MKPRPHPPRRVLVAPDKFKGTLTGQQAARAIVRGLRRAWPRATFTALALADGGEGFAQIFTNAAGGRLLRTRTRDAIGRPCRVSWGLLADDRTAVLDLAAASGLAQLPSESRDPRHTSTVGTGIVLRRALDAGATTVIVGLGGSATNDGGIGIAGALGWRFLDRSGADIPPTGAGLLALDRIVPPAVRLRARVIVAADVDNPLFGARGAAFQFGPQKGAGPAVVRSLDHGLRRLAEVARRDLGTDFAFRPGAGAAGGVGFGLMTFFGATLEPGFELFRRSAGLDALIARHDLVVTGEGCFDLTSLAGKGPYRLSQLAREHGRPVWGLFGRVTVRRSGLFEKVHALVGGGRPYRAELSRGTHGRRLESAAAKLARTAKRT